MIIEGDWIAPGNRKLISVSGARPPEAHCYDPRATPAVVYPEGCVVFPGFIDLHVHARQDELGEWEHKEDYRHAKRAAINGGVVAFCDMPNTPSPVLTDMDYYMKLYFAEKVGFDIIPYALITENTNPIGNVPYKVFFGQSTGSEGRFFSEAMVLKSTLERYRRLSVSFHCEDPRYYYDVRSVSAFEDTRPPQSEVSAITIALDLIHDLGLRGKICHVSTAEGLEKIMEAKKSGVDVTVEVTPHHLYFNKVRKGGLYLRMYPPLRSEEDRAGLMEAVKRGDIDFLASDHAPHTLPEKMKGAAGVPHLDTYGAFVTWLIEQGVSCETISEMCSENPRNFLDSFSDDKLEIPVHNLLKNGGLTVLNMDKPTNVYRRDLYTKCGWSPFEGDQFPGSVEAVWINGEEVRSKLPVPNPEIERKLEVE